MPFTNALHVVTVPTGASDPASWLDARRLPSGLHIGLVENMWLRSQPLASGPSSDALIQTYLY